MHVELVTTPGKWKHLWCKVVRGAKLGEHCQRCLVGPAVREINTRAEHVDLDVSVRPGEYLYICGVSYEYSPHKPETYGTNLHVVASVDEFGLVSVERNDVLVDIAGGSSFEIPALPIGFGGLDTRFTKCRNYQFAVAAFGR